MANFTADNAERSQGLHFGDLAAADLQSPYGDETGGQGRVGEWIRAAINRPFRLGADMRAGLQLHRGSGALHEGEHTKTRRQASNEDMDLTLTKERGSGGEVRLLGLDGPSVMPLAPIAHRTSHIARRTHGPR